MSGLNLLRQSLVQRSFNLPLRIFILAVLGGGLAGVLGTSCVVPDPEYCANTEQCPAVATELGMTQQVCHPSRHVCVVSGPNTCLRNEDCTSDFKNPRCDLTTNSCVPCTVGDNSSCAHFTERPLCVKPSGGTETMCVACQTNADCQRKEAPICDGQQCRKCSSHSDCEGEVRCDSGNLCTDSLVCIQAGDLNPDRVGQCAQNGVGSGGHVVYVNGSDLSRCGSMINATGNTLTSPLCNLDDGLDMAKLQGRHYIRALGSSGTVLAGLNKSVTQGSYAFIGAPAPSKGFPDMVTIKHRGTVFDVSGTGSVMVDRFNILEVNPAATALSCSGGPTAPGLSLRSSVLTGSTPIMTSTFTPAIILFGCNSIIEGNIIGVTSFADVTSATAMAHGVGINIIDNNGLSGLSSYLIQNNVIAGNASIGISIAFGTFPTSKFVLRFNTIYGNGRGLTNMNNSPGGVGCPGNILKEFSHSIIANNFKFGGSQVNSGNSCSFKDIVVDSAEMGTDAAFTKVSSIDSDLDSLFRLLPTATWAIDKVTPAAGETLPSQDVYGVARPQNGKWDIGAAEFKP